VVPTAGLGVLEKRKISSHCQNLSCGLSSPLALDTVLSVLCWFLLYKATAAGGVQYGLVVLHVLALVGKLLAQIPAPISTGRIILQGGAYYLSVK
jgi:hypothetical protein